MVCVLILGCVLASHTWVFPNPVSLSKYREVMAELEPGKGLTHVGPQPVTERVFAKVASLAG